MGKVVYLLLPSVEKISTVCFDPQKGLTAVNEAEVDIYVELLLSP